MPRIRQQLSMFLSKRDSVSVESVRRIVDPVQYSLIPAHVTLCKEDELGEFSEIETRLKRCPIKSVELTFGKPDYFDDYGIIMRCTHGIDEFQALREYLLDSKNIKDQRPHITLAHPRNPKAEGNSLENTILLQCLFRAKFEQVFLIEQIDTQPWSVLNEYYLNKL